MSFPGRWCAGQWRDECIAAGPPIAVDARVIGIARDAAKRDRCVWAQWVRRWSGRGNGYGIYSAIDQTNVVGVLNWITATRPLIASGEFHQGATAPGLRQIVDGNSEGGFVHPHRKIYCDAVVVDRTGYCCGDHGRIASRCPTGKRSDQVRIVCILARVEVHIQRDGITSVFMMVID